MAGADHGDRVRRSLAQSLLLEIADAVIGQKEMLGDLDARNGDGDHGINMAKGFALCRERKERAEDLPGAFRIISDTLLLEIGGSMGPLYGSFFAALADEAPTEPRVEPVRLLSMFEAGYRAVVDIGGAAPGDKTLVDTLAPALAEVRTAVAEGEALTVVLDRMKVGAIRGRDSTRDMVARIGRASRLGERSRGSVDAGAASCCLILCAMADGLSRNQIMGGNGA